MPVSGITGCGRGTKNQWLGAKLFPSPSVCERQELTFQGQFPPEFGAGADGALVPFLFLCITQQVEGWAMEVVPLRLEGHTHKERW